MPLTIPRLSLIFYVLCLGLGVPVHAERKPAVIVGAAPPQPVELNIKVRREGKTEIPLRIYGKAGEPLKYLIRVPPAHGRLSDPRATEREVSVVVYEPPADLGITTDKFSFAVQSAVGVSAAVEVAMTIVDQPPQLAIQDAIDFSTVRAGASNFRLLEISNHGGLIASGDVIVDPPWKIDGKAGYRLRNGDVAVFKIVFSPSVGGKFEGVARFTSEPEHSTTLRGVSESAITAEPAQWVLQQIPGDSTRSGNFELTNQLDEPRTLRLKTDARLKIPAQVTIPPHGRATIPVEASSQDAQAMDTEIQLEASDFSIAIPVRVPVLAAVFRATTPLVSFGRLAAGHPASARFQLENIGGTSGKVSWEIIPPFRVTENSATIQPGDKKEFPVEIESTVPGRYRTWLKLRAGDQSFDIPVEAEVAGAARSSTRMAGVPGSTATVDLSALPEPPEATPVVATPLIPFDWDMDPRVPSGVEVSQITPTSAIVEWPAVLSPAARFRVDMRQLKVDPDGRIETIWLQPTGIPIEARGKNYAAILTGLQPGEPWAVRIMTLPPSGEATRLFTVTFQTPPKTALLAQLPRPSLLQCLLVALLGLAAWHGWQWWRRRPVI
ncbi:MAG: fibronectin type III domain-containing protein [Chthoniobacter sp.]|uniref:fibronectin type III domain-containing protein n=1 Tax=Chthoniobacter sp. TaxID=2510640 RepID=UPI0032AA86E1